LVYAYREMKTWLTTTTNQLLTVELFKGKLPPTVFRTMNGLMYTSTQRRAIVQVNQLPHDSNCDIRNDSAGWWQVMRWSSRRIISLFAETTLWMRIRSVFFTVTRLRFADFAELIIKWRNEENSSFDPIESEEEQWTVWKGLQPVDPQK